VATLRALPSFARSVGLPRSVREQWSLHPARIAELFVPRMFGPLFNDGFWGQFTVSPPWQRNYIHSIYAGAIGPALVATAVWKRRRNARPWVLLACATLMLSLGDSFFHLYGRLGDWIPPLRVFRYPQRIIALFAIACEALDAARGQRRIHSFRVYVDQDALSTQVPRDWEAVRIREYNYGKRNLLELCGYRETVSLNSLDPADQLRLWREVSPLRTLRVMGTRFAITAPEAAQ